MVGFQSPNQSPNLYLFYSLKVKEDPKEYDRE